MHAAAVRRIRREDPLAFEEQLFALGPSRKDLDAGVERRRSPCPEAREVLPTQVNARSLVERGLAVRRRCQLTDAPDHVVAAAHVLQVLRPFGLRNSVRIPIAA